MHIMIKRRELLLGSLALTASVARPDRLLAQPKEHRPLRMVVPFAAGGGVDVFARLLAEKLRDAKGFTIVVENRGGGSGTLGGGVVRQSEPDGTTVLFSAATHLMAKQVLKSAPYDPIADFTPIARVGEAPMLLVMAPTLPQKTIADVLADARKQPDKWIFATSALGAPGHLATIAFNKLAGLNLTIIPYRGTAPGLTDVAAGHVQLMIDPVLALLPMAQGGQVKALAVTSAKRTALAPDIPTAAESGLPGLEHATWYGVWGPKGMSEDVVATLNGSINDAIRALAQEGKLAILGIEAVAETSAQFAVFAQKDLARNADLLRSAKFEPV
jgi:tripartite-type tricarboxylate transporter receptor subunit TctC